MRPLRILISGGCSAIPLTLLLLSGVLFTPQDINAQCPSGSTAMATTYTKSLSFNGGTIYPDFTLPQFNPSPGGYTLLSAVLSSTATTSVSTTYQNTVNTAQDFFPSFARTDNIKVNGTTAGNKSSQYDYPETILNPQGSAGDQVSYGPANLFNNSAMINTTITNPATLTGTYQGTGTVSFRYTTIFSNNFVPNTVNAPNTISDNISFSLTYNYCNPTTLASNIVSFTATRANSQTVDLKWSTTNEHPGRKYYIEVSVGGQDFAITGSVPSNASNTDASYTYNYSIPSAATGKLYFRLRQVDADGTTTWSDVRIIYLDGASSTFSIYPNPPSDFINLTIPGATQDWQVDIFAADGSLVQRSYYRNANTGKINFGRRLAASTYFVRATSPQTGKHYTGSFVVSK